MSNKAEQTRTFARDLLALADIMDRVEVSDEWHDRGASICSAHQRCAVWSLSHKYEDDATIHVLPHSVATPNWYGGTLVGEPVARIRAVQAEIAAERDREDRPRPSEDGPAGVWNDVPEAEA